MRTITTFGPLALACAAGGCASTPGGPPKSARFEVVHEIKVKAPGGAKDLRLWMAMPQQDEHEDVLNLAVEAPFPWRETRDSGGNRVLYLEATAPLPPSFTVVERFVVARREQRASVDPNRTRPLNDSERRRFAALLAPNQHIVIDDSVRALAREIVGSETNPIRAARAIYDWTLANIDYWVKDPKNKKASPVGSSEYCLSTRTGNCTDFHSLYAALARASGIPTRMLYGSFLKKELDGQDVDQSYHCWIEFWAPEIGWVPLDVAIADIFVGDFETNADNAQLVSLTTAAGYSGADPAAVSYYFGNLEERRVLWTIGRDLMLDPPPAAGAVHALPKAYIEVDGAPAAEKTVWTRKLTYREVK
jgi:transglutaminase-like putative cysteine protease